MLPPAIAVLAVLLMVRELPLVVNLPFVIVNVPATVSAAFSASPPAPFIVRLFTLPMKEVAGNDIAKLLPNVTVAPPLLASITPEVTEMLPPMVKLFAPTVSVPFDNVNAPLIVLGLFKVMLVDAV